MSLPGPATLPRRDADGGHLCSVAGGDDRPATIQWAYEVTTEEDAGRLAALLGTEVQAGDTVPVFACAEHVPAELRPADPMNPTGEA